MRGIYYQIGTVCVALLFSQTSYAAKEQCQRYLDKLHNIQSQQRQSHGLKRSNSLNKREAKARNQWWQCEQGRLKVKKSAQQKKAKKSSKRRVVQQKKSNYLSVKKSKKNLIPFQTSKAIVAKSRYEGKQLQAWLAYYQKPKHCARPKTTQQFAFCVENRLAQQESFEKQMVQ